MGYHLEWKLPQEQKPWLRVTPSHKSIEQFKRTLKEQTRRNTFYQSPLEKVRSLNRVMRGWNQYYEHVNATQDANKLTFWANDRLFLWLKKRHKKERVGSSNIIAREKRKARTIAGTWACKMKTDKPSFSTKCLTCIAVPITPRSIRTHT